MEKSLGKIDQEFKLKHLPTRIEDLNKFLNKNLEIGEISVASLIEMKKDDTNKRGIIFKSGSL